MKELKDYLHLYLGCGIVVPGVNDDFTLTASNFSLVLDAGYKPVLRPLSSMTDEECEQASIISGKRKVYLARYWAGEGSASYMYMTPTQCYELTRYLLSKGFDLYNLIESNLAVASNK